MIITTTIPITAFFPGLKLNPSRGLCGVLSGGGMDSGGQESILSGRPVSGVSSVSADSSSSANAAGSVTETSGSSSAGVRGSCSRQGSDGILSAAGALSGSIVLRFFSKLPDICYCFHYGLPGYNIRRDCRYFFTTGNKNPGSAAVAITGSFQHTVTAP